ncbi:MAG: hypothetical protein IJH65_03705 [Methanobrevibacter sp.]|nr:hypothetical protein [Methanobrevibacter sp.]
MLAKARGSSGHTLPVMVIKQCSDNRDYNSIEGEKGDCLLVCKTNYGSCIQ